MTPWDRIASLARFAPSPHNTQPLRIVPVDDASARIVMLPERMLPREDHGNLYLASAFGVFVAAMRRAAVHHGFRLHVVPRPDVDVARLHESTTPIELGEVRITLHSPAVDGEAILRARRTSRLPYHDREIDRDALQALMKIAERAGHQLIVRSDDAFVSQILRLNAEAVVDNLQLDDERREVLAWSRFGATPEFGDGLWEVPMHQPGWQLRGALTMPRFVALPGIRQIAVWSFLKTQRGTRHVALLRGPFRTWPELVAAGEMLFDFWIAMAEHDVYMHPMGSMLTNATYAARIADAFGVNDGWLAFRLGYSDVPPRAPRLETIVAGRAFGEVKMIAAEQGPPPDFNLARRTVGSTIVSSPGRRNRVALIRTGGGAPPPRFQSAPPATNHHHHPPPIAITPLQSLAVRRSHPNDNAQLISHSKAVR